MTKILFTLLFLLTLIVPKSGVFAQEACPADRAGAIQGNAVRNGADCPAGTCFTQQTDQTDPSGTAIIINCHKILTPEEAAAKAAAGATGNGPTTSAKAVPCPGGLPGIMTAIGCVPTEPKALVEGLLKFATLAGGGVAFLLMILGALQMITAEGNPESIKHGQERFYSAIIGLLLIIFAVLLMQVIGVDILGLPRFGGNTPVAPTRDPNS